MLTLDGREGEGGGQILRLALALGAITGTPFRIHDVRGGRSKPGLLRQHLTGVRAVAEVCAAQVEGAHLGSTELWFTPGPIAGGAFRFAVGTAGSAGLVLQAVLPVLWHAPEPSTVTVTGGTHNPASPPAEFLARTLAPTLARMGFDMELRLDAHGFYPAGGGGYTVQVTPVVAPKPLDLTHRGELEHLEVVAWIANLPESIGTREIAALRDTLTQGEPNEARIQTVSSPGPGNAVTAAVRSEALTEVFTAFGRRRVPAERIGEELATAVEVYRERDVPVGPHLADQLVLPLAIAGGQFLTGPLSSHCVTAISIVERFTGRTPRVLPQDDQRFLVECSI